MNTTPRMYMTRSTRDGLGIVPDGTHPVLADGKPDFESFTTTQHALDFIRNTPAPVFTELLAAVSHLDTNNTIFDMKIMLTMAKDRGDTAEALPYWKALYILTKTLEAAAGRDPFSANDLKTFKRALAADGVPALTLAGLITTDAAQEFLTAAAATAPVPSVTTAPPAGDFADIIKHNFPEGY